MVPLLSCLYLNSLPRLELLYLGMFWWTFELSWEDDSTPFENTTPENNRGKSKCHAQKYMMNTNTAVHTLWVSLYCLQLRGNEYRWKDLEEAGAQGPLWIIIFHTNLPYSSQIEKKNHLIFLFSLSHSSQARFLTIYLLTVGHPLTWDSVYFAMVHSNKEIHGQRKASTAHGCKWIH